MDRTEIKLQNHDATSKSLETQVGQISQILNTRPIGGFPSDTEVAKCATHEQCKAITTRSGRVLKPTINQKGTAASPSTATDTPADADESGEIGEDHNDPHNSKVLRHLEQVHTNLPLVEALHQMPNYAKFLKDMVSRKKRIEEFETASATETCLALMHNKVPAKQADPGSFTIECSIGHYYSTKALCDPGASINLMPKSVFKKLGIGEAKPTTVMLQLFIFAADFLFLDCEADENAPIILERPFLSTSRATIDFDKDEIVFKVDNEQVKMKALTSPRQLKHKDKGKGIDNTPIKSTQRPKLYMGAHIERDKGVMFLRDS
ncbi:hypothetical protein V6N11_076889 [Hibiscus sabdariffa]|uniref:Uncharacterized protein n=1 Tax=Hibiscus sabdariffa TaxID=183260 RepID=A0ABR2TBS8_9ROSI